MKIAIALIATLLLLAGCGGPPLGTPTGTIPPGTSGSGARYGTAITVALPDSRSVICVVYDGANLGASLSCDWDHAR